jgi:hypothetical protein
LTATATLHDTLARLSTLKRKWFIAHLADPRLAARGVALEAEVAVPLGGTRRGGYVVVVDGASAQAAMKKLRKRQGFPDLRYEPGRDGAPDKVRWGEAEPGGPDPDAPLWMQKAHERRVARFYGYSEAACYALIGEGPAIHGGPVVEKKNGRTLSAETRARMSNARRGLKPTPEARAAMSAAQKRRYEDPAQRAKLVAARMSRVMPTQLEEL